MQKKGHIFFVIGISGSGKGTLIDKMRELKLENVHLPLSYRSRAKRPFEIEGIHSHFVSVEQFKEGIEKSEFLEYAIVHGKDYYGTKYTDVLDNGLFLGKIVIKEIDIHGLKRLIKEKPELRKDYSTVFLSIPTSQLEERICARGECLVGDELQRRIESSKYEEVEIGKLCDYRIDSSQEKEKVLGEFLKILENFKN